MDGVNAYWQIAFLVTKPTYTHHAEGHLSIFAFLPLQAYLRKAEDTIALVFPSFLIFYMLKLKGLMDLAGDTTRGVSDLLHC